MDVPSGHAPPAAASAPPVPAYHAPQRWATRLADLEPLWILALGPLLFFPGRLLPLTWHPALLLALFLFWPIRLWAYRRLLLPAPVNASLGLILLWIPVTVWVSVDRANSWVVAGYILFGLALACALINWRPAHGHPLRIASLILAAGLALTALSPVLSELSVGKLFRLPQLDPLLKAAAAVTAGNVNANTLAGALVLTAPLFLALALRQDWTARRWLPWLCLLAGLVNLLALFLTQSRGAYMAAAAAVGLLLALRWPRLLLGAPLVAILLPAAVIVLGPSRLFATVTAGTGVAGLEGRLELWRHAWRVLAELPLTGIGLGAFDRVVPVLQPYATLTPDKIYLHAHNLLLQTALDLGTPGLVGFLATHLVVFALLIALLRRRSQPISWTLAAGTLCGLVALHVHGLFDAPLAVSKPAFLPWLLVALAVRVWLDDWVTGDW